MDFLKEEKVIKEAFLKSVKAYAKELNISFEFELPKTEIPAKREMGDLAFPTFSYAKIFKKSPVEISQKLSLLLDSELSKIKNKISYEKCIAIGGYVNIFFDSNTLLLFVNEVITQKKPFKNDLYKGKKFVVEFSCPNTNKPLHLGHLRNDCIGSSISKIIENCGAEVKKVNLINDRGVHICKSMLAYQKFGQGSTPKSTGKKGDHFVGDYYVRFAQWEKEEQNEKNTPAELAQDMLLKWENGDKETVKLWKLMRTWSIEGLEETYKNTNVSFDKYYYESELYKAGKEIILKGLKDGLLKKDDTGAIVADLNSLGLGEKVLLRSDGTSIYITQDIATAIQRHKDFDFDSMIYVVGNEQNHHFKVLFAVLDLLGYSWAKKLTHLSYGMVNLPNGKMKSREGTVVDADDLILKLEELSSQTSKNEKTNSSIAHNVALGSLNYLLLSQSPSKDMIFNPEESVSFSGETGAYLQYTGARISSLLKKGTKFKKDIKDIKIKKITQAEKDLLYYVYSFTKVVYNAGESYDPSIIANYLYMVCKYFSHWYHDEKIIDEEDKETTSYRLFISSAVLEFLKKGFELLNIPYLSEM